MGVKKPFHATQPAKLFFFLAGPWGQGAGRKSPHPKKPTTLAHHTRSTGYIAHLSRAETRAVFYVMAEAAAARENTGVAETAAEDVPEEEWRVQAEAFKNEGLAVGYVQSSSKE